MLLREMLRIQIMYLSQCIVQQGHVHAITCTPSNHQAATILFEPYHQQHSMHSRVKMCVDLSQGPCPHGHINHKVHLSCTKAHALHNPDWTDRETREDKAPGCNLCETSLQRYPDKPSNFSRCPCPKHESQSNLTLILNRAVKKQMRATCAGHFPVHGNICILIFYSSLHFSACNQQIG